MNDQTIGSRRERDKNGPVASRERNSRNHGEEETAVTTCPHHSFVHRLCAGLACSAQRVLRTSMRHCEWTTSRKPTFQPLVRVRRVESRIRGYLRRNGEPNEYEQAVCRMRTHQRR